MLGQITLHVLDLMRSEIVKHDMNLFGPLRPWHQAFQKIAMNPWAGVVGATACPGRSFQV
jgi:hypothetical protein